MFSGEHIEVDLALPVILLVEHIGRFGANLFLIIVPIARPFGASLALVFLRVKSGAIARP